jgi:hypothetical protein
MKPTLTAPGSKRLRLKYDQLLSNFAFKFNLRRYNVAEQVKPVSKADAEKEKAMAKAGRCRLTLSHQI